MRIRFGFFPYSSLHYKAAQAYLNKMSQQSWALKHIYPGGLALFTMNCKTQYFVDLDMPHGDFNETDQDYLQLCTDAGWELVQDLRGMLVFRSAPGADPVPIQNDQEIEWERFWERNRPKLRDHLVLLGALALLAFVLFLSPPSSWKVTPLLLSNCSLLMTLFWILTGILCLLQEVSFKRYMARCKKSGQVELPSKLAVAVDCGELIRRAAGIPLILLAFIAIFSPPTVSLRSNIFEEEKTATVLACQKYPTVMAYDLGLTDDLDDNYSRYLTGRRSLLCEYYDYSELSHGEDEEGYIHILTTEYYDCTAEFLAQMVFDSRARETRNGSFTWGELEWENAPDLGFDESYTCQDGAYLLFRQDNVVALVGCTGVGLTTPENLQVIRERLGLE